MTDTKKNSALADPVPAKMTDALEQAKQALEFVALRYDDEKSISAVAQDAYEMASVAKAALAAIESRASAAPQQELYVLLREMVKLHKDRQCVLTVHMDELERLLAAPVQEQQQAAQQQDERAARAIDALDGMGFKYDEEIGWLPPQQEAAQQQGARVAFEAWATGAYSLNKRKDGTYYEPDTASAWAIWQDAQEEGPLADRVAILEGLLAAVVEARYGYGQWPSEEVMREALAAAPAQPQEQPVAAQQQEECAVCGDGVLCSSSAPALCKRKQASGDMTAVARRNLRAYLSKASFATEVDRHAAVECLDVLESAIAAPVAAQQQEFKECRHCGFECRPVAKQSKSWYPLQQEAGQARELPPLPAPYRHGGTYESSPFEYYTADQMREYARAAQSAPAVPDVATLRRIVHELRTYNPAADEHKGAHIHSVWAREIEAALASAPAQPTVPELRNIMGAHMLGDFVVQVEFPSCRAAGAFKAAIDAAIAAAAPVAQKGEKQ